MCSPRNQITLEVRETSWPLPWPWGRDGGWEGEGQAGRGSTGRERECRQGAASQQCRRWSCNCSGEFSDPVARHGTEQEGKREDRGTHYICTKSLYFLGVFTDFQRSGVRDEASVLALCNTSTGVDHSISSSRGTPGCLRVQSPSPQPAHPSLASVPFPTGFSRGCPRNCGRITREEHPAARCTPASG